MTITINHPQSGRYQGHKRLRVAAIGVALVVSLAIVVQVTTTGSATESTRDVATDQVFDLDQARSEETARLAAINEIPWGPATSVAVAPEQRSALLDGEAFNTAIANSVDAAAASVAVARAAETARLLAVNEIRWEPAGSVAASQADNADRSFFRSINDADEPSTLGATTADGDLAFFLSINDVDG